MELQSTVPWTSEEYFPRITGEEEVQRQLDGAIQN